MPLLAASTAACNQSNGRLSVPPAAEVRVPDSDPGPDPHLAPGDEGFIDEAPGVVVRALSRGQRDVFLTIINTESAACGAPHSLAQSLRDDPDCHDSTVVAQFVADAIDAGATTVDIRHDLPVIKRALSPQRIDIGGRPIYGSIHAPVTVVVFADFECPHCRLEAGKLRTAIDRSNGKARLVYKHFPLGHHKVARLAAIASEIAHKAGKFWAMHDQIFANQHQLTEKLLFELAANVGLDDKEFAAAYGANTGEDVVDSDLEEGRRLAIMGTPTVFVDGRKVNEVLFGGTVEGWIADALARREK